MPSCPNPYVWMDGGGFIKFYDPTQPLSATNPSNTNIPTFGGGLTLMPNINGGTLTPTFYTTSGGTYWYWSGTAWVNTGHATGNGAAVNLGGCNGAIYNLVGGTGQVYAYYGNGPGTLLTTLAGFNGGGPYDLVTDCNCNFYALNTTAPNQTLTMYSPAGAQLCTYTLNGMPSTSAGGGFAIIGNTIYVKNNLANGFFIGNISGSVVTFTQFAGFLPSPGDFASCPVCNPVVALNNVNLTAALITCSIPTVNLLATTNTAGVTYLWSGPGIVGPNNGSVIAVNVAGVYTCVVSAGGCPPAQLQATTVVLSNTTVVMASITPSGNVCTTGNGIIPLTVSHQYSTDLISWSGPNILNGQGTSAISIGAPGLYSVSVTDVNNGCVGFSTVQVAPTPTLTINLSSQTLCAQPINGSPASITITPGGASNYTLLASPNFSVSNPFGSSMVGTPIAPFSSSLSIASAVLLGSSSFCSASTNATFAILPNPTINVSPSPASMCSYSSQPFSAFGATNYTWTGLGLNNNQGNNVIATPSINSVYSIKGETNGCYAPTVTTSLTVLPVPNLTIVPATSTICLGASVTLSTTGNATLFLWSPAAAVLNPTTPITISFPSNTAVISVVGSLNTCTSSASATVNVQQPPTLGLVASTPTVCHFGYNGSPNNIQLIPTGATGYTLLGGPDFLVSSANGPVIQLTPGPTLQTQNGVTTATLLGETGVCLVSLTHTFSIINNPTVTISPPSATMCPLQTKAFTASGASSYFWTPDPTSTLVANPSIIASPPFTQFYSVYGSSLGCNSLHKNASLVVFPIPHVASVPSNGTICAGSSIVLTATGTATSYSWSPSANLSATTGSQVIANPPQLQIYTVLGTLNTCTNSAQVTVSTIPIPVVSATASDYTVCTSSPTTLKGFGAFTYSWLPPAFLNNNLGQAVIASPDVDMTYTVNGFNGICTGATTIHIHTVKRPDLFIEASQNRVCYGEYIPLKVKGAQSYTWQPMQSIFFLGTNTLVNVYPKVNTNYTVEGTTSEGTVVCWQQISYSVMVVDPIIARVTESVSICAGEKTTLIASGGNWFEWKPKEGLNVDKGSGVVANPTVSTIYTVDVSQDTYCGVSTTVYVAVNPKPLVWAGDDATYNLNEAIFITGSGTGTLSWSTGEGIRCPVCPITQIFPTSRSCYVLEAVNDYGCASRDEVCIDVTEDFSVYVPNTFTPNNDGNNDVFYLYGENLSKVSMEIFDRWGLLIFSSKNQAIGWDGSYKGVACAEGIYTYLISYVGLNGKRYERAGHLSLIK